METMLINKLIIIIRHVRALTHTVDELQEAVRRAVQAI